MKVFFLNLYVKWHLCWICHIRRSLFELKYQMLNYTFVLPHSTLVNVLICFLYPQDARRATELEAVMEKQKMKVDLKLESSTLWAAGVMKRFRWRIVLFWWCRHLRVNSLIINYIHQRKKKHVMVTWLSNVCRLLCYIRVIIA